MFGKKSYRMVKNGKPDKSTMQFRLDQNFPNPFTRRTVFNVSIPKACEIRLTVLNNDYESAATLFKGIVEEGLYSLEWDGCNDAGEQLKGGSYVYQLQTPGFVASRRLNIEENNSKRSKS